MTKVSITDHEELREPVLPKGDYMGTITNCYVDIGSWGGHEDVERVVVVGTLHDHPDCDFAQGSSQTKVMPVAKGMSNDFVNFCRAWHITAAEFDSDDFIGRDALFSIACFESKQTKELRNAVNAISPAPEGL